MIGQKSSHSAGNVLQAHRTTIYSKPRPFRMPPFLLPVLFQASLGGSFRRAGVGKLFL